MTLPLPVSVLLQGTGPARGLARTQSFPNLAAGGGDVPADVMAEQPASLRRAGSLSEVPLGEPESVETPLLSGVPASELAAVVASVAGQLQPRDGQSEPTSHVPSVDSAIDLLLQAKVTLEWDVGADDAGRAAGDDTADSSGSSGGGDDEAAAPWGPEQPAGAALATDAGWLHRLRHAWTNRPRLLPGLRSHRPPPEPSAGSRQKRRTTTSVADLLRLMRVAAAARAGQRQRRSPGAAAAPWRPRRRRSGPRPARTDPAPTVVTFKDEQNTRL